VRLNDTIIIRTYPVRIGTKSFTVNYNLVRILEGGEELCAKAESVLVCYDYHQQKTIEVPLLWRNYLTQVMVEVQKS
jgi:acyl-CoA thioesterase FadM